MTPPNQMASSMNSKAVVSSIVALSLITAASVVVARVACADLLMAQSSK